MPTTKTACDRCQREAVCDYTNYETFTVAMLLSNDRPMYEEARAVTSRLISALHRVADIAEALESMVEQWYLDVDGREMACKRDADKLAHELMTAALARVDWREIAEEWINTVKEG
jgi:hypothetical protein